MVQFLGRHLRIKRGLEDLSDELGETEALKDTDQTSSNPENSIKMAKRRYNKAWFGKRSLEEPVSIDFDSNEEVDKEPLQLPKSYWVRYRRGINGYPSRLIPKKRIPYYIYKKWSPMVPSWRTIQETIPSNENDQSTKDMETNFEHNHPMMYGNIMHGRNKYQKERARQRRAQAFTRCVNFFSFMLIISLIN